MSELSEVSAVSEESEVSEVSDVSEESEVSEGSEESPVSVQLVSFPFPVSAVSLSLFSSGSAQPVTIKYEKMKVPIMTNSCEANVITVALI